MIVAVYFTRYSARHDLRVVAGYAEERPALLYSSKADASNAVRYVVLIEWSGDRISSIRDFHYVDYISDGLAVRTPA